MKTVAHVFPAYTIAERRVDAAIHVAGIVAAPMACLWLLHHAVGLALSISLMVYCAGLVAMLGVSALYNMLPPMPSKEIIRRLDHAVIFIMIAGTYTPLAVNRLPGYSGILVGVFVWCAASGGIALALAFPHRFQRLKLALYLLLGWTVVTVISPLSSTMRGTTLILLLAGGIAYSVGAGIHHLRRVQFHNAIWHALVLLAASLHFVAITTEFIR
jgi:hemolysin III